MEHQSIKQHYVMLSAGGDGKKDKRVGEEEDAGHATSSLA